MKTYLMTQIKQNVIDNNNERQNISGWVLRVHRSVSEDRSLMGYNTMSLGKWFLIFCEIVALSLHQILGTICQTTQCHISQDLSLINISNYTVHKNAVHMCCLRHVH